MGINLEGSGVNENISNSLGQSDTKNEVFTPDSIVREMLDETDNILKQNGIHTDEDYLQYIVLEPTCGTGNFLIRELERKLRIVNKYTGTNKEIALLKAVSSIHGIELTARNVIITKLRLMDLIKRGNTEVFELAYKPKQQINLDPIELTPDIEKCVQYILDRNIQCGNSLTSKKLLINKSDLIQSIWNLKVDRINDSMFNTSDVEVNLRLTQYDFTGNKVALRERSYYNMHSRTEIYYNTTSYVDHNKVYTLDTPEIYKSNNDEEDEGYDF